MTSRRATFIKGATFIKRLDEPVDAASLAFFRIVFGCIMLYSQVRFVARGWVERLYIRPGFFFKYYGFGWIHTLPGHWMYLPWLGMIVSLVFIILGKYYRVAMTAFFILFTYTQLLDLTNYLNHYYFISLLSFIMIFLPMHAAFSFDARGAGWSGAVPRWTVSVLRLQVGLVYVFAGLAKIKYDWLINAEPLKIWLGTCENIPVVGRWLSMGITAYLFSWIGMLFDLTAPFLLMSARTRKYEYAVIVVFHVMTLWLFYIGMFPLIMMGVALIFFSPFFHRRVLEGGLSFLRRAGKAVAGGRRDAGLSGRGPARGDAYEKGREQGNERECGRGYAWRRGYALLFGAYFVWQLLMPLRYLLYKGNVLWTEQGFRYAWNVMLMEKDGYAEFQVKDKETGREYVEFPKKYLTPLQEKMMSTQPDMLLQYAHFLAGKYRQRLQHPVAVYVYSYVSLNRRPGQIYIDPATDLSQEEDGFLPKRWILPEEDLNNR